MQKQSQLCSLIVLQSTKFPTHPPTGRKMRDDGNPPKSPNIRFRKRTYNDSCTLDWLKMP